KNVVLQVVILLIYNNSPDGRIVSFFLSDFNYVTFNLIIEHTFLNIECRLRHNDVVFQCLHFQRSHGYHIIIEQKSKATEKNTHEADSLSNYVVNIQPEELQHKHEECDKECGDEGTNECAKNKLIKFLDHVSLLSISLSNASVKSTVFSRRIESCTKCRMDFN